MEDSKCDILLCEMNIQKTKLCLFKTYVSEGGGVFFFLLRHTPHGTQQQQQHNSAPSNTRSIPVPITICHHVSSKQTNITSDIQTKILRIKQKLRKKFSDLNEKNRYVLFKIYNDKISQIELHSCIPPS